MLVDATTLLYWVVDNFITQNTVHYSQLWHRVTAMLKAKVGLEGYNVGCLREQGLVD